MTSIKKKGAALATAGVAALAVGGGLFAWQANTVNVENVVAAGTSGTVQACTTDAIIIDQNDAVWNGIAWTVDGATVSNSGQNGAASCVGMTLTLTAYDSGNAAIAGASGTSTVSVDINDDFAESVSLGSAVSMTDLDYWTVSIN